MTDGPWLVTGASGFLGRHLLQHAESGERDRRTIALVRVASEWHGMEWTRDLTRTEPLVGAVDGDQSWTSDRRLDGLGGIFHLAALVRHSRRDAAEVYRTNVDGTLNMVRLAAVRRCRLVFVSTSGTVACFRDPSRTADEGAPYCENEVRHWPYYHSKVVAEREARRLADELGVELVIVRPPVLLGPGDHKFRATNHVIRFLRGRLPFLIRGGMHFTDVRDAASAVLRAMSRANARPVYHLPGTVCSIEDFYGMVARAAGEPPPRAVVPFAVAWWVAKLLSPLHVLPEPTLVEMGARYWGMTSRYAADELGYTSRRRDETLAETVQWIRANPPAVA